MSSEANIESTSQNLSGESDSDSDKFVLTKKEEELIYSIETANISYFIDIGGPSIADLNFKATEDGITPLMIAAAKGNEEMVRCLL